MIIKDKMRLSNSYPNCAESIFSGCLKGGGRRACESQMASDRGELRAGRRRGNSKGQTDKYFL